MFSILCICVFPLITTITFAQRDAPARVWNYPADDYFGQLNFELAEYVSPGDVKLVYFNSKGVETTAKHLENLPTKILLHGWLTSIEASPWYEPLKEAYLHEAAEINVIYVDYSGPASKKYSVAAPTSHNVGKVLAMHLLTSNVHPKNFHLIGHSLGAHVAGYAGRHIFKESGQKVGRMTFLDPAGPKFNISSELVGPDDAQFIDVIHTNCAQSGLRKSVGHVDFFPNGGREQPGCPPLDIDNNCSHARSTLYFIESVAKKPKICRAAASWEDFQAGKFLNEKVEIFGEHISQEARGNLYCVTNDNFPFFNNT